MAITANRVQIPPGTVGYIKKFGVPVDDEDGADLNLDGLSTIAFGKNPQGTTDLVLTAAQRTTGSNIMDVTISAAQMTTGDVGEWLVDCYAGPSSGNEEPLWRGRFKFIAEPKETEA